jgi:hypothetical protein
VGIILFFWELLFGNGAKKRKLRKLTDGKTPEQKAAIFYFEGTIGGCFGGKTISDEEYESMVMTKAKSIDFKKRALDKIGLDESQVSEVVPIHFENYFFGADALRKKGGDDVLRSSSFQVTWLFFSSSQVHAYQYTFNMDKDGKNEVTEEYFYKDITNFKDETEEVDVEKLTSGGCGKVKIERTTVEANRFAIVVSGGSFYCEMKKNDYTDKAIQGMKAKLREKKA